MVSLAPPDDPVTDSRYSEHEILNSSDTNSHNNQNNSGRNTRLKTQKSTSFAIDCLDVPEPDLHYVSEFDMSIAGMLVTDAINFRNISFRSDRLVFYQVYQDRITRFVFVVFPILLMSLALIEEPAVKGLNVHWQAALGLELICLIGYTCRVIHLRYCIDRRDFWMDIKNCVVIAILIITVVDVVVWLVFKVSQGRTVIRVSRVLRPLLIVNISENRNIRKLLRVIKRTVIDVISVLVLIFLFIGIFAMMATKFFERRSILDPQGDRYLDNFFDAYWNLYVLMTTANSPDIGLPAFQDENAFFFFFSPFSIITTFILMNILLAVVYKHYRIHLLHEVKVDVSISQHNLQRAFKLLRDPKTECIGREVWLKCYQKLGCSDVLQRLYWEYMVLKPEDSGITLQSFCKITDLLSSKIKVVFNRETWLGKTFPSLYNSSVSCYLRFAVEHSAFTFLYDILIFANAVALSIKDAPAFLESIFLVLFNIEIALKIYTLGPVKFGSSTWNVYDCLVIWSASIFSIIMGAEKLADTKNAELSLVFFDMVLTLRVLRLLKLLTSVPQLRLIISTIMQIVPSMGSYALLLLLFYYSYAIVGMEVFKGKIHRSVDNATVINCGNDALLGSEFLKEGYCVLTFNSIWHSMVILWTLTLVNQWHIIADGFVRVTSKWARLYFLSFHVIVVLIILNIFLAFVIEAFMLQIELDKKRCEEIEEHMDERGVNARKHSSLTGTPTWYKTSSTHQEEEDHEQICIGTTALTEKVRYMRHKSAKSYNQMLLDMFQADIQTTASNENEMPETSGQKESLKKVHEKSSKTQKSLNVTFEKEDDLDDGENFKDEQEDILEPERDEFSVGSLQDLDII